MASNVTLASMRSSIQLEGSWENSADITTALLNDFINRAVKQVWDILKSKRDDRLVVSGNLSTAIGVDTVALPATFYELRKLEIADPSSASGWRRLRQISLDVAHQFGTLFGKRYRYRLQGSNIVLHPTPQAVETLRLFYIPVPAMLSLDADTFDGVNGYEELVFQMVVKMCRDRQDQDVSVQIREIDRLTANIRAAADGRDVEPHYLSPYGVNSANGGVDDDELYWTS